MNFDIYGDISTKFNGNVYVGVVGPVRVGKSAFISGFMKAFVLPNILNKFDYARAVDELPQSADGNLVMTTQPKFIPAKAVGIEVANTKLDVRLVDSVGYMVEGVKGDRLVKTPWSEEEIPFEVAGELGTKKVIREHSTFSVCVTTDGSIGTLGRGAYEKAEEKVVGTLKENGVPFVMVLNSSKAESRETKELASRLSEKYGVSCVALNVLEMGQDDVENLFGEVLKSFPVSRVEIKLPKFLEALPFSSPYVQEIVQEFEKMSIGDKIADFNVVEPLFVGSEHFLQIEKNNVILGEGVVLFEVQPKENLFYTVLSDEVGIKISDDFELISSLKDLGVAKREYDKIKGALEDAENSGYGVVCPTTDAVVIDEPITMKQGGKYGIKLRAHAPSLHIMKVDIDTEISPTIGTENDTNEVLKSLQEDSSQLLGAKIFGKSVADMVEDSLKMKVANMPVDAQYKMRKTLKRIINEGKGGIICILL